MTCNYVWRAFRVSRVCFATARFARYFVIKKQKECIFCCGFSHNTPVTKNNTNFRRYYQWQTIIAIIARILRIPARTARTTARIILRIPRTTLRILRMILRTATEDNLLSTERQKLSRSRWPLSRPAAKTAGFCAFTVFAGEGS